MVGVTPSGTRLTDETSGIIATQIALRRYGDTGKQVAFIPFFLVHRPKPKAQSRHLRAVDLHGTVLNFETR
jgi:hypothetical protein